MRLSLLIALGFAAAALHADTFTPQQRAALLARAGIWRDVNTAQLDLTQGPPGPGAFAPGTVVTCAFEDEDFEGHSPKFRCRLPDGDSVKVKFGPRNGEVHGEVAASRLLWALGFQADRMYPVRIVCHGCPDTIGTPAPAGDERVVDPAVIERPIATGDVPDDLKAWSFAELSAIDPARGGASRAEQDALTLAAAFLQHSDSKPEQQRLVCLGETLSEQCAHPFVMINDLGLTFGRASLANLNAVSSANLEGWRATPVWKYPVGCITNLAKSFTGTLRDPLVGEDGRALFARLLNRLTVDQIRDLFAVAGMDPQRWTPVFVEKRRAITERRCAAGWSEVAPRFFGTGTTLSLQSHASGPLTAAMNALSVFGDTRLFIALATVIAFAYHRRAGASLLLLLALTGALTDSAKVAAGLPRPDAVDPRVAALSDIPLIDDTGHDGSITPSVDDDDVYGFPSGHMAALTAFLLGLALIVEWRSAWIGLIVLVPLMALSRLYLGRHFPADVIGGVAVGVIATGMVMRLRLPRLDDARRGRRTALRVGAIGLAAVLLALTLGLPQAYEAGRLAGFAFGVTLLALTGRLARPVNLPVRQIVFATASFAIVWWLTSELVVVLGAARSRAGDLVTGALPAFALLAGPFALADLKVRLDGRFTPRVARP